MHEASLHDQNCFITLTYDDSHLPQDKSLDYPHFQRFMKRLRKRTGLPVRFFMCGEYGDLRARPHYHACLFGYSPPDGVLIRKNPNPLYSSKILTDLWPYGISSFGALTFDSAAYVARYVMKKITGHARNLVNTETGEISDYYGDRIPEFCRMSLKPGIGADWLRLYYPELLTHGFVWVNGHRASLPRFYEKRLKHLGKFDEYQHAKHLRAQATAFDRTPERLAVREQVAQSTTQLSKRKLK